MNQYFFYSIILISLSLLFFMFSFIMFFLNKILRKKETKIKKKFNKLELIDFKAKIETISSLSNFNNNFEFLINMSFEFQEEFKNKLMIIKENILYLNELNSNFNIYGGIKLSKKIFIDLDSLSNALIKHDEDIDFGKKLYEKISDLSIEYIEINKDLLFFYEKHIMRKYDNNFILNKIKKINECLNNLSLLKKNFDNNNFFNCILDLNKLFYEISSIFKNLYSMDRFCSYIKSNIDQIENKLVNDSKSIINIDSVDVEKKLSLIKSKYSNIINELKYVSFDEAKDEIIQSIWAIQKINSIIEYTIKTDIFYSEYLVSINNYLSKICEEKNNIYEGLNEINKNFSNNKKIFNQINYINKLTDKLIERQKDIKYFNEKRKASAEKNINFITETINSLYTWVISFDTLIKLLEDIYSNFSNLIKEISNIKFSIAKIIGSIYEYNILENSIVNELKNEFKQIENIEQSIHKNHFKDNFIDILADKNMKLIEHITYVEKEIKYKFFCENLLIFSNKFILKNNLFKNKIEIAENFYFNKNYKKSIHFLLKELKKIN